MARLSGPEPEVIRYGELVLTVAKTGTNRYDLLIEGEGEAPEIDVEVSTQTESKVFQL